MKQYIDKDALVAEIKRRIKNLYPKVGQGMVVTKILKDHYEDLLDFIDTLEVKEVELEKSARYYLLHEHISPLNEVLHQADLKVEMQYHKDIENAFKAGFELGLKTQHSSINILNMDDLLVEEGIDPYSKEAKVFKESYYMALEKLKA